MPQMKESVVEVEVIQEQQQEGDGGYISDAPIKSSTCKSLEQKLQQKQRKKKDKCRLKWLANEAWKQAVWLMEFAKKDPRRPIHGMKVGLALCLSSLFMLVEEPPRLLGENAIWAIMTVVVVFEFTVGATLSKGLNRGLGTILAALAGIGVAQLADLSGEIGEAAIICVSILVTGACATFVRFIPKIKAKYDYGVLIFLLTFSLISVSSYQTEDSLKTATTRMYTIFVGCGISLVMCMFLFPVWAGEDLHNMIARNFDTLAECLQGSVNEYLKKPVTTIQAAMEHEDQNREDDDVIYVKYRTLLSSNQTEESLATFASWEPPHGRFMMFRYPWNHYVKVGAALRHCAYASMALHGCLLSEVQAPHELRQVFRRELLQVTSDAANTLRDVGNSIRRMDRCEPLEVLMHQLNTSTEQLQEAIDSRSHLFVTGNISSWALSHKISSNSMHQGSPNIQSPSLRKLPSMASFRALSMESMRSASNFSLATFSSLLIETVARLENVVEAADRLGSHARFKPFKQQTQEQEVDKSPTRPSLENLLNPHNKNQNDDVHKQNAMTSNYE